MTMSGAAEAEQARGQGPGALSAECGPTAYYDGACPLCAREIGFYRRQEGADLIRWVDVSAIDGGNVLPNLTRAEALARFTVRDADGVLVSGSPAFVRVWKQLPRFRWIAAVFETQPFAWLLARAYDVFLRLRPRLQALAASRAAGGH